MVFSDHNHGDHARSPRSLARPEPPTPSFFNFHCKQSTFVNRPLGHACAALGWPLHGPCAALGPPNPNRLGRPIRLRVATPKAQNATGSPLRPTLPVL